MCIISRRNKVTAPVPSPAEHPKDFMGASKTQTSSNGHISKLVLTICRVPVAVFLASANSKEMSVLE